MRLALWPHADAQTHLADMDICLSQPDTTVLVAPRASDADGQLRLAGFAEVGTRSVAESCETSPVAYLEGWYVDADVRRRGVGAALVRAAEEWARARGFREFASDTQLANTGSHLAHEALGFTEVERWWCTGRCSESRPLEFLGATKLGMDKLRDCECQGSRGDHCPDKPFIEVSRVLRSALVARWGTVEDSPLTCDLMSQTVASTFPNRFRMSSIPPPSPPEPIEAFS
jgi:aminoglycoside 6'-N-acetyltransferase I